MAYQRVNWQNSTKYSEASVTIDGETHIIDEANYLVPTPLDANNLNKMDEQISNLSVDYIVESGGDNSTGYYEKWASGKLVQWGHVQVTTAINVALGSVYRTSAAQTITFPKAYINQAYKVMFGARASINSAYAAEMYPDRMVCFPIAYSSQTAATRYYFWEARGFWK